jgi:hypothetical protein
MKKILLVCVCLYFSPSLIAQTSQYTDKDYAKKPLWINMMDDPKVNFFDIEKAYKIYWEHHVMPETESDNVVQNKENNHHLSKRERRRIDADNDMRLAVKKYEWWHLQTLPYVQPDGRILTADERLQIWKQQQNEQQKINK